VLSGEIASREVDGALRRTYPPLKLESEGRLYKEHCISVVVPVYNEERFIASIIDTMPQFVDHVFVVDDCSSDDTANVVSQMSDKRVQLLKTPENQGVGAAMVLGYRKAVATGSDIVVKMDGDGQMAPEDLPALLDALIDGGYDYAKGNRFLNPESLPDMPRLRLLGNVALTFMTKLATGYWNVFDPQNGYTAIRAGMLQRLNLAAVHERFFFENDMLVQLSLHDAKVKDVAIPARYGAEMSSLNPLRSLFTFPALLFHRFWRRVWHNYVVRDFDPIALFLMLGLPLLAWGTAFGIYTWLHSIFTDEFASTGTIMLSVLPVVVGFQLVLQAIVLDIQHSPR
jgi:glycosyltransferase involved in cell wall biosynthesis